MEKEITCQTSVPYPAHEQRQARAMNALKEAMLKLAMSRDPSRSHSQQQMLANLIDARLPSLFPSPLRTPNHPPYAEMIYVAIGKLKKKKGTTKASISNFMNSNYEDLPLAHEHLLTHHLQKLVQEGMILSVTKSLYALPNYNYTSIENYQQAIEQQQIVLGGEIANFDVNDNGLVTPPEKHPTTALVEVVEPVDVDDSGAGLMVLPKRHCTDSIEVESNGNDDNVSVELKVALNENLEPLQKKLRRCSPRLINEKRELKQPEEEAVKISEIIQSAAATVSDVGSAVQRMICNGKEAQQAVVRQDDDEQGLIALPEKHSAAVTELESMDGDDAIGLLKKSPAALHEAVNLMVPVETDGCDLGPPWLKPMIKANYFIPCEVHGDKCDMFCVDCTGNPICSNCSVHHKDHHIIKIRRFQHHSIIDMNEVQKYMDISGVQTYTSNKKKSVYLNDAPLRKSKNGTVTCEICSRRLHFTFRFCSLGCKIERRNSILPYMEETSRPTTDCEKQQQVGGQQLIVVGGEMENDTGLETLAEKHPETAIVEVIEPADVDGVGLMAISGNHSMAVIGYESNGCGDSVGDGLKHSGAIIEEVKPLQTKLILPYMEETSRPTTDCEKQQQVGGQQLIVVGGEMENDTGLEALAEKHPENAIVEVIEPADVDGVGLMAISGNHSMDVIGYESNGCGDSVGDGLKHSVAIIEEVKPLQTKLILSYMEETSRPTTDCEKQQQVGGRQLIVVGGEMENDTGLEALAEKHPENAIVEVIEPADVDGVGLMAISGNHSMAVIGYESNACGDSVGDGLKHSVAITEEVKPVQTKLCQYSRRIRNKKRKFEQQKEEVVNNSEINASITATMNDDPSVQIELNTPPSQGQLRWCQVTISRKTNNREQQQQQELVAQDEVERGLMTTSKNYLTAVIGLESIDVNESEGAASIGLLEKPTGAVLEAEQTSIQQSAGPVVSLEKLDDDLGTPWLKAMLKANYHIPCEFHGDSSKSGCDRFCLNCLGNSLCSYCLVHHMDHHIVQIRRNHNQNVIKVNEVENLMDISGVQICTSTRNIGKIVYLTEGPHRSCRRGYAGTCKICPRSLHLSFRFCSLGCKVLCTGL